MPTRTFVGLGSGLDPPGLLELCLADDPPAAWRTRPNIRVVFCRAVVKIYHGRNTDHTGAMWHTTQGKADKAHPKGP